MRPMKDLFDSCVSGKLKVNDKIIYKHKAWGYCSDCGFGSCEHLNNDSESRKRLQVISL